MTNESNNAEEGVFVLDPDDQDATEDTIFDENEEVPEEHEHEQQHQQQWQPDEGPADPRRVRVISSHSTRPLPPTLPAMLSPYRPTAYHSPYEETDRLSAHHEAPSEIPR